MKDFAKSDTEECDLLMLIQKVVYETSSLAVMKVEFELLFYRHSYISRFLKVTLFMITVQ